MNPWISGMAIFGLTLSSCIPAGEGSRLKVLGGLESSENASVVLIENGTAGCTGTFVAKNVILTAGHCNGGMKYNGNAPVRDIVHPRYGKNEIEETVDSRFDLRVLIFKKPLSNSFVSISSTTPSVGDSARIIGFGCNQLDTSTQKSSGAGRKRAGDLRIDFVSSGILQSTKKDVAACYGDSGGPLLNKQGEIVGVTAAISWEDEFYTYWADVNNEENRQFISEAMSQAGDPSQAENDQNNNNPTDNPPSDGGQQNPPSDSTVVDCMRDYSKIRAGGSGVCINRSSGFCYRYGSGDVLYDLGKVSCSGGGGSSGNDHGDPSQGDNDNDNGGSSPLPPSPVPPSPPSSVLDCNKDYLQIIHSDSSGVCLNRSSGYCYKYSGGNVRYDKGRVSCPGN
jgi:hypothetical protein